MTTVPDSLFFVNSNADTFANWLETTIRRDQARCCDAWTVLRDGGREYQVAGVRRRRTDDASLSVQVDGSCSIPKKNDPTTDWLYFIDALVEFRVLPLSAERCEVSARWQSGGERCAKDMLARIGQRWPEAASERRGEPGQAAMANRGGRPKHDGARNREMYEKHLSGSSHKELADEYNLSKERVKQIVREQRGG